MWDKKIIAISTDFSTQEHTINFVEKLSKSSVDALVLRQKQLDEDSYYALAKEVLKICAKKNLHCILHNFYRQSLKLNHRFFHAPLKLLNQEPNLYKYFHSLGTSIHSKEELELAYKFKVNYAFFGHVFQSACKANLKPKGIEELKAMLKISKIPLYAIGGINTQTILQLKNLNIAGVCIREAFYKSENLKDYVLECKNLLTQKRVKRLKPEEICNYC
ncbi:thiamine phosphate synthase [Campylobacter peloridis]|uniref:thiamine phosphate synthase n=1 Tax=Campylobacter peloridis TaxID=488546 RepID=UPI001C72AD60|nr:thiamine phosphate synthase [Campylobacter peloridis]MBX1885433.1 thiamine phosphate synthase [Campylobacter peloridis]